MRQYRIGLMVGNKSIEYVHAIKMGVQNTLEESGHTLVAISDLIPFHSRINAISFFRVAFEITSRLDLDAVIVPAGIISGYLTDDQTSLSEFLHVLDPRKTLVIEREIPGYRCISKDNAPGMHGCMRHLIENCGFRNIAFIGGPENSAGARERESIYYEEMREHGLDTPPSMFARGDFSGECGTSIEDIIDNNPDLEAIACACDLAAHSVYRVLHKRRLAVGKDIAVTGFDDNAISAHLNPPLSTVHITGYDLGCMAAREAIRLCEGKPQEESVLSSMFIARNSCGEDEAGQLEQYVRLLDKKPFPANEVVDLVADATLMMASRHVSESFRYSLHGLLKQVRNAYAKQLADKDYPEPLFTPQDLTLLFNKTYRNCLSLEGFQSTVIGLLRALASVSPLENANRMIEEISNLHHGIARMLNADVEETKMSMSRREWISFHITDDAIRESTNPQVAYRLILEDLSKLGIRQADLFLLPEPVEFMSTRTFALSDSLRPIGHLCDGHVQISEGSPLVRLQELLSHVLPTYSSSSAYTVGGLMAGNELMGVIALDAGTLDDDGQLIALLNMGIALKHLQMIANERESNEILSKSNLLLEHQSHYDEMTGILNRRGFMAKLQRMLSAHVGHPGALFYLDLDGLKFINDTYGHDSGDEAIRQTTHVLSACLPPDAILGRLGGDEFVAFTLIAREGEIDSLGKSVDAGMATFNATHSYPFDLAISYGGVPLKIDENTYASIMDSLAVADERLYQMKKKRGRGRT